jgi:cobalamin biosynthetic protein CobC
MSKPIEHGGRLSRAIETYGGTAGDWLDLSTGINPCPPPLPSIPPEAWHRLPDADRLRKAEVGAARFYGLQSGDLPLAVPGTQAVIQHLPALVASGRSVAVLGPTYGEYARVLSLAGHPVDAVGALEDIAPDHGLAVVVNPNNPTGRHLSRHALLGLADRMADRGGRLLVDEAFGEHRPEESVAADAIRHPGLVVFRSFGKFFGYAGLRLGFVMAEPAVLARFATALGPWAVSGPALAVAQALLDGDVSAIRAAISERKRGLETVLESAGLQTIGGTSLFALVELADAGLMQAALCRQHILTRVFDYAPRWLRIGLAPDAGSDARLLDALRQARA